MKKASTEMRKERVTQDDFGSHVKVLRKVSAGARSRSRHVRPLGRVFAHFRVFAFREKSLSAPASKLQGARPPFAGRQRRELRLWKRQ